MIYYLKRKNMNKINNLQEIKQFTDACDEMLESKFILVDKRIGDVLKSIAQTKPVYNLMATCLAGFNFEKEYKLATSKGRELVIPTGNAKVIAFVFCMLNAIDDKKLNINEILQNYFSGDDCISSYKSFCKQVILPFKVCVVGELYEKKEKEDPVINENIEIDDEILKRLVFLLKDLKSYISGLKKIKNSNLTKDEIIIMINHMIWLCENKIPASLRVICLGLRAALCGDKELNKRMKEVENIIQELN